MSADPNPHNAYKKTPLPTKADLNPSWRSHLHYKKFMDRQGRSLRPLKISDTVVYQDIISDQTKLIQGLVAEEDQIAFVDEIKDKMVKCYSLKNKDKIYYDFPKGWYSRLDKICYHGFLVDSIREGYGKECPVPRTGDPEPNPWARTKILFSEGVWVADRRHGEKVRQYTKDGFLVSEGSYNLGAKDGFFKIFSPLEFDLELHRFWEEAAVEQIGSIFMGFKSDSKAGMFKSYFRNGKLQKVGFYRNNMMTEGTVQQFYKNGQIKYIADDWEDLHEGNVLASSGYIQYTGAMFQGIRNGTGQTFYPNGVLAYDGDFNEDRPNQRGSFFDENGDPIPNEFPGTGGCYARNPLSTNKRTDGDDWQFCGRNLDFECAWCCKKILENCNCNDKSCDECDLFSSGEDHEQDDNFCMCSECMESVNLRV